MNAHYVKIVKFIKFNITCENLQQIMLCIINTALANWIMVLDGVKWH